MGDDFDFNDGFDFTNLAHTALLDDTNAQLEKTSMEKPPRKPLGCLVALFFTATGIPFFLNLWL